jgi:MtaA/CmuA family methyltransferase
MDGSKMTSYQRVLTALEGGKPDFVPMLPLVYHWTYKQFGFNVIDALDSVEKVVYSQYNCARDFGYDTVNDYGPICAESHALGSKFKITENILPSMIEPLIKDFNTDLKKLTVMNPYKDGWLPLVLESVRRLKELCGYEKAVVGFMGAPFRCAAALRGTNKLYIDIKKNKEQLHHLLEYATINELVFGIALAHMGADVIMISDPTSSGDTISRSQWEEYGFIYTKQLVKHLKKTGVKIFFHVCGNVLDRLDSFTRLGVDGISVDEKVDLAEARRIVGDRVCLIGNVSPADIVLKTPEEIREKCRECIEKAGKEGAFILSGGCMIPPEAKNENIRAMVEVAHNYKY